MVTFGSKINKTQSFLDRSINPWNTFLATLDPPRYDSSQNVIFTPLCFTNQRSASIAFTNISAIFSATSADKTFIQFEIISKPSTSKTFLTSIMINHLNFYRSQEL